MSWTDNHLAFARPRASKARQIRCQEEILASVKLIPNNFYYQNHICIYRIHINTHWSKQLYYQYKLVLMRCLVHQYQTDKDLRSPVTQMGYHSLVGNWNHQLSTKNQVISVTRKFGKVLGSCSTCHTCSSVKRTLEKRGELL